MTQSSTALIIIDVQSGFFSEEYAVYQAPQMLENFKHLIATARQYQLPIIFMRHDEEPEVDGSLHPELDIQPNDIVISKMTPDSFYNTTLYETLQARGVQRLIIAGFQTEFCIDTTCRRARSLDYKVVLVKNAHSTFDFEDTPLPAAQTIAHHSHILEAFGEVKLLSEINFE